MSTHTESRPSSAGRQSRPSRDPHATMIDDGARPSRPSLSPGRPSLSSSLDAYVPARDVVAPISVRPNAMELLWVCGDCGAHYKRQQDPPESCSECGAPKTSFYAPIED